MRAASSAGASRVAVSDTRRLPPAPRAAADAAAAAEATKRRAADIGVDEFLDGAFKELGSGSDDDSGDDGAAAASDGSDSDEARAQRACCHVAGAWPVHCASVALRIGARSQPLRCYGRSLTTLTAAMCVQEAALAAAADEDGVDGDDLSDDEPPSSEGARGRSERLERAAKPPVRYADGDGEAGGALAAVRASNDELRSEAARHKAELEELKRKV